MKFKLSYFLTKPHHKLKAITLSTLSIVLISGCANQYYQYQGIDETATITIEDYSQNTQAIFLLNPKNPQANNCSDFQKISPKSFTVIEPNTSKENPAHLLSKTSHKKAVIKVPAGRSISITGQIDNQIKTYLSGAGYPNNDQNKIWGGGTDRNGGRWQTRGWQCSTKTYQFAPQAGQNHIIQFHLDKQRCQFIFEKDLPIKVVSHTGRCKRSLLKSLLK